MGAAGNTQDAGSWVASLARATQREEEKWAYILARADVPTLHNWALLELFNSCMDAPRSDNGRRAFLLFKAETESRLHSGHMQQFELDRYGVTGPSREVSTA